MPGRRYKIGTKQSLTHTTQARLVADRALNPFGSLTQQLDFPDYRSFAGRLQRLNLIVASGGVLADADQDAEEVVTTVFIGGSRGIQAERSRSGASG